MCNLFDVYYTSDILPTFVVLFLINRNRANLGYSLILVSQVYCDDLKNTLAPFTNVREVYKPFLASLLKIKNMAEFGMTGEFGNAWGVSASLSVLRTHPENPELPS